jgi:alpha-1,2-mannosyltransferase
VVTELGVRPLPVPPLPARRSSGLLGALALAGSLVVLALATVVRPAWFGMIDLAVYRAGGAAVLHGQSLYGAHAAGSQLPFTYPPFAGLLFAPAAAVPWPVARAGAALAWLCCLTVVVAMCLDLARRTRRPGSSDPAAGESAAADPAAGAVGRGAGWWQPSGVLFAVVAAGIWLEPIRGTLAFGQVNLVLLALVLADLTGRPAGLPRGVLIGLAAGLKLTPAIFIGYLLLTGRARAAATALATFAGTIAVGWLLLPADSAAFWGRLWYDPGHVGGIPYSGNQSLYGLANRLLGGTDRARLPWLLAAAVVGVGGLLVAAATHRAGHRLLGIGLCALTGLLVCPISWNHHWVWALPVAIAGGAAVAARPSPARIARLAGWIAVFGLSPIWWVPHGGDREYRHHGWQLLLGNAYLLAGLAALALAAVRVTRRRNTPVPSRRWSGRP